MIKSVCCDFYYLFLYTFGKETYTVVTDDHGLSPTAITHETVHPDLLNDEEYKTTELFKIQIDEETGELVMKDGELQHPWCMQGECVFLVGKYCITLKRCLPAINTGSLWVAQVINPWPQIEARLNTLFVCNTWYLLYRHCCLHASTDLMLL